MLINANIERINANIESYSCREGSAAVMSLIRYLPDNVTSERAGSSTFNYNDLQFLIQLILNS